MERRVEEISSSGGPGVGLMEPLTEAELWLRMRSAQEMVSGILWSLTYYLTESRFGETTERRTCEP